MLVCALKKILMSNGKNLKANWLRVVWNLPGVGSLQCYKDMFVLLVLNQVIALQSYRFSASSCWCC